MILTKPVPHLADLLGGYFHLDWELECTSEKEAVQSFIADVSEEELRAASEDLTWLIDQKLAEPYLQRIINDDLDCPYWADGKANEFLSNVQRQLNSASSSDDNQPSISPPEPPSTGALVPPLSKPSPPTPPTNNSSVTAPMTKSGRSLDFESAAKELVLRPFQFGLMCWFILGATSCFKISWVRLKDFNYANPFFTESVKNDGWYTGLAIGVLAGLLWAASNIWKRDIWQKIVPIIVLAAIIIALARLPISGRWGNFAYEETESAFLNIQNAKATSLLFYKTQNYDVDVPVGQRTYASRFKRAKQRTYVRWQLNMSCAAPKKGINFTVDVLLRRYDGNSWSEVGWSHPQLYAESSSTQLEFSGGWGLVKTGVYQADFWIAEKGLAQAQFELY